MGERDWPAITDIDSDSDPHELASWVNEIPGYRTGTVAKTDANASPLAFNLVHPQGKLAGVLSQQCWRNIKTHARELQRISLACASGFRVTRHEVQVGLMNIAGYHSSGGY